MSIIRRDITMGTLRRIMDLKPGRMLRITFSSEGKFYEQKVKCLAVKEVKIDGEHD